MEGERRLLRSRNPLSDCTNTRISSQSSTPAVNLRKPNSSSAFKKSINRRTRTEASDLFDNDENASNPSSVIPVPPSFASTPSRPTNSSSSVSGLSNANLYEPHSVYSRRKTSKRKSKGKEVVDPGIFKLSNNSGEKINEMEGLDTSKLTEVPHRKKQRRLKSESDALKQSLPQDFIEKQRAYFAEIDAFELPEEEVGSDDELE